MRRSVASEQPMCVAIEVGTRSPGQAGCWRSALTRSWWPIRPCRGQRHATDVSVVCGRARGDRARGALPGTDLRGGVPGLQGEGAPLGVTGATAENLFRAKVAQGAFYGV